jgi:type I restriction enzyme S subunit
MTSEKLQDIALVTPGTSPKGELINSIGIGLPFFQGSKEFRELYPVAERYTEFPVKVANSGDVLISVRAPVGEVNIAQVNCSIGRGVMSVRAKKESEQKFIFYFLKNLQGKWDSLGSTGSVFENLSTIALNNVDIPAGLSREAIGEILFNLDQAIATNNTLSKTLEDIAQTIFKSWFIDFDPVKAKLAGEKPAGMDAATAALFPDSMEESELGLIPKGWQARQLKSALVLHKSTIKAGAATESAPYVPIDQIGSRDIFLKNSMSGSEAKTSLVSFVKNEILFGAMRPYFHKVVLAPFDGTTRTTTFVLRAINPSYLAFSLLTVFQDSAVAYATNHSQGTTIPYAVWNNSFENYPLVFPSETVATAFNNLVLPLIEYGYSLVTENQKLVQIRDSLLPRLISGELQIPEEILVS